VLVTTRETLLNPQSQNLVIGRQPGIALSLDHSSVSRQHATISNINGQYILRDLGSANGTFVNDRPLAPDKTHILQPNDKLRFGDVQFRFQLRQKSSNTAIEQKTQKTPNIFQHIRGSQLERNMVR